MIPPGIYRATAIAESVAIVASKSGAEQIEIELAIDAPGGVQKARTFLALSDRAAPYTIKKLRALGWTGSDLARISGLDLAVNVEIRESVYEGKTRSTIDIVTPRETKPLDARSVAKVADRLRSLAAESATEPDADPARELDVNGDEIPF